MTKNLTRTWKFDLKCYKQSKEWRTFHANCGSVMQLLQDEETSSQHELQNIKSHDWSYSVNLCKVKVKHFAEWVKHPRRRCDVRKQTWTTRLSVIDTLLLKVQFDLWQTQTPLVCLPQQCEDKWGHLCALADFAIALNESIQEINKHSFNNFELRIGKSSAPLRDQVESFLNSCFCLVPFSSLWILLPLNSRHAEKMIFCRFRVKTSLSSF